MRGGFVPITAPSAIARSNQPACGPDGIILANMPQPMSAGMIVMAGLGVLCRRGVILSSLTGTYRRYGIDPQRYLMRSLTNFLAMPVSGVERWLADKWKQSLTPLGWICGSRN
jgi:hypothetical protein